MRATGWAVALSAVCVVVAVAAVAYAAGKAKAVPVAEVVRARRFELVDTGGGRRAVMRVGEDGAVRLEMEGHRPGTVATLTLRADADGRGTLWLRSGKDGGLASIVAAPDGSSVILNASGLRRSVVVSAHHDGAFVEVSDPLGHRRATLGATVVEEQEPVHTWDTHSESSLVLFDEEGEVLWQTP